MALGYPTLTFCSLQGKRERITPGSATRSQRGGRSKEFGENKPLQAAGSQFEEEDDEDGKMRRFSLQIVSPKRFIKPI